MIKEEEKAHQFDMKIFTITLMLIGIGIAFMYGASANIPRFEQSYFFYKQLRHGILALFLILFISKINPKVFFKFSSVFLFLSFLSLILVFIPGIGQKSNEANRWINLGFMTVQPSEFSKIAVILFLSKILARKENDLKDFIHDFLPILLTILTFFIIIFLEPDFSTAFIITISALCLMFIAGAPTKFFLYLALTGIPALYFLISTFAWTKKRLLFFVEKLMSDDPNLVHHQELKARKAIESAGLFGNGLGIGSFNASVPEQHTDFYFVNIVADTGLIGALAIIFLFLYMFLSLFKLGQDIKEKKYGYLVTGLTLLLCWQTIVNLGSVLGLLPITGLPLPFLSYGGSSLITAAIIMGMILSLSRFSKIEENH